ncbi:cytochrome c oxidase assembly protein [Neobacillus vireti]|uniref:cytochrome c oxidase assembly protein n=1 Tax=Neobacillus vireti TaxID=220686 RepID=UPI0030001FC6
MHNSHHLDQGYGFSGFNLLLVLLLILSLGCYFSAVIKCVLSGKAWPFYRVVLWILGIVCIFFAVSGPIANRSHLDFNAHMLVHLLLGMLAPLLLVLAAPMTLTLKTVNVKLGRRLTKVLRSKFVCFISGPITSSVMNIGVLWLLYSSTLYRQMHEIPLLNVVVHVHIFLAGYVFTSSIIYIDPAPHRTSFLYRAMVFATALAGHGILAKYIYAHPPAGVPAEQAQGAGMLMYYGGDAIDLVLIVIFCYQWYKASRPVRAWEPYY